MADETDRLATEALDGLIGLVIHFGSVFLRLPVPITLPSGLVSLSEVGVAMERAAALSEFEPMPEEHKDEMRGACIMWLSALTLLDKFHADDRPHMLLGTYRCLESSREQLLALAEFLMPDEEDDRS